MSKGRIKFDDLKKSLERLAASLLPAERPNGLYSASDKDRIHAYVVLAHPELEEFIENVARSTAEEAKRLSRAPSCEPLISRLMLYRGKDSLQDVTPESIQAAYDWYEELINQNHGLRPSNIFRMLMPLGLTHRDFDVVLINNLDAFGRLRGGLAHTTARLAQGTSPSSEKKRVDDILLGLVHLDQRVRAFAKS